MEADGGDAIGAEQSLSDACGAGTAAGPQPPQVPQPQLTVEAARNQDVRVAPVEAVRVHVRACANVTVRVGVRTLAWARVGLSGHRGHIGEGTGGQGWSQMGTLAMAQVGGGACA